MLLLPLLFGLYTVLATQSGADLPPPPLKTVPVPIPANIGDFIKDRNAAIRLGKALFWDQQIGSDGQACASCHFNAGTDNRAKNQLNPGLLSSPPDTIFGNNPFTGHIDYRFFGPNYTVVPGDFPLHKLANPNDQDSKVLADTNDVLGPQGVFLAQFVSIVEHSAQDKGIPQPDDIFHVKCFNTRRVEPRNPPTVFNAVFNFHNFWDGRANGQFNGVNPFGPADTSASVLVNVGGNLTPQQILVPVSSLASQAVGPPVSNFEMSYTGRTFADIGKKMLSLRPLGLQIVHPNDSVLGPLSRCTRMVHCKGLNTDYATMIRSAFQDKYWNCDQTVQYALSGAQWHAPTREDPRGYYTSNGRPRFLKAHAGPCGEGEFTQMEANFAMFFGLAIQMYESTLVADNTPFDRFLAGNTHALTPQQQRGMNTFFNKGNCSQCHGGAELTEASVSNIGASTQPYTPPSNFLDELITQTNQEAFYDAGFTPTSVRPLNEDPGRGGVAPFTNPMTGQPYPLAEVLLMDLKAENLLPPTYAAVVQDLPAGDPVGHLKAVNGCFKVPGLRNVELTGPYFHNGGQATLMQVVKFYNRGSDFANADPASHDNRVTTLNLTVAEQKELVAFLLSLTDERVRNEMAPFDHPQIKVPNGLKGNQSVVFGPQEDFLDIPAVGAGGRRVEGLPPLQPFLGLDPFTP